MIFSQMGTCIYTRLSLSTEQAYGLLAMERTHIVHYKWLWQHDHCHGATRLWKNLSASFAIGRTEPTPLRSLPHLFMQKQVFQIPIATNGPLYLGSTTASVSHEGFPIVSSLLVAAYSPIRRKSQVYCRLSLGNQSFLPAPKSTLDFSITCGSPSEQIYPRIPLPNLKRLNHLFRHSQYSQIPSGI